MALVVLGVTGGPTNDWPFALLMSAMFFLPLVAFGILAMWMGRRFDRKQYLDEEKTVRWLVEDRGYDETETRREFAAAKSRLTRRSRAKQPHWEDIARNYVDETFFTYSRNLRKLAVIAAEEGLFFAPIAYFGLPWPAAALLVTTWGLAHYPFYTLRTCFVLACAGMISVALVLPHGILTHALGHFLYDYLITAWTRQMGRVEDWLKFVPPPRPPYIRNPTPGPLRPSPNNGMDTP